MSNHTDKKKFFFPLGNNPWILYFPFLIAFVCWALISPTNGFSGDEARYLEYAHNLLNGFYSPPAPNIELINGPGYPIFLLPFVALGLPLITITICNAFMYYISIVVLHKALLMIVSQRTTLIFSLFWGLYYIAYQGIPFIHTETLTYLLVVMVIHCLIKSFQQNGTKASVISIIWCGFFMGYLVLTKMIFGHVLIILIIGTVILRLIYRNDINIKRLLIILAIALGTTSPYLIYTYRITGKLFYWGNGNDSLYWMTATAPNEYGSWFPNPLEDYDSVYLTYYIPGTGDSLIKYHREDLEDIKQYTGIDKDDAYFRHAIENIKDHPSKFVENYIYNVGRFIFQYPFSYGMHRPKVLIVFPIQGILLTLVLISLVITLMNWRRVPFPIKFLLFMTLLYCAGSTVVTAYLRMFTVIVPILVTWIAYMLENAIQIKLKINPLTQNKAEDTA